MSYDAFISYGTADSEVANLIVDRLRQEGLSVFWDHGSITTGENWMASFMDALEYAPAVIVLLSKNSVRSRYIQDEISRGLRQKKFLIPVLLDDEAKNNWTWPLLADRQAIYLDMRAENWQSVVIDIAKQVTSAVRAKQT